MNSVKAKDLNRLFSAKGYNPVIGDIYRQQQEWLSWYRGMVDGFHSQQRKNAEGVLVKIEQPSLQMAKKVSEDVTSLLFNEKVMLTVGDKTAQGVLDKVLKDNFFTDEMQNFIELTCVYGTGVVVEYIVDGETKLNFLFGDKVVVIDYDNTTPKAVAVIQEFMRDEYKYNHIMYHTIVEGNYRITHEMYRTKSGKGIGKETSLSVVFTDDELNKMRHITKKDNVDVVEYYVEYESEPHFQVFKLGISNNFDPRSPMGISLYANSMGTLENIDEKYFSGKVESVNKRARIFVDDEATKLHKTKDAAGNIMYKKYFDSNETQFQTLKGMSESGNKAIEIYAPEYKGQAHDDAIQNELNYLAFKCMLGTNYYSFKDGVVGYQNELGLALSNAPLRRDRNKNLNKLTPVLIGLMKAILFLEQENGNYSGNLDLKYEVSYDDDIFTDDASKLAQLRLDVQDGFIPEWEYVAAAYNLTEEEAKAKLLEAEGEEEEEIVVEEVVEEVVEDAEE